MIGLVAWCRVFKYDAKGNLLKNADSSPQRIAHPLAKHSLWDFLRMEAPNLSSYFDSVQLPPMSLAQGGTGDGVDGYEAFEYRNFNGTHWGNKKNLQAAIAFLHACGMLVSADVPLHQMGGENGGPGVFNYHGRRGETTPSWFQGGYGNHDPIPPFVKQDDIPSLEGAFPFGRPRSYQNSIPHGVVENDTKDILQYMADTLDINELRWDDVKATHVQSVARIIYALRNRITFNGEYDDGNSANLNWWATSAPMNSMCAVAEYSHYWNIQRACNHYDATQIDKHGTPFWQMHPELCIGFVSNPDVATTWAPDGGISQQIAFNLLSAYAVSMSLPFKKFMVYAEDYFPSSAIFPTGRGLKPAIDNLSWVSRTFAFGRFERRWVDKDVYCYTRDGNGGEIGWSGGLLVAVNFNTYDNRYINVQTTWPEGTHVHDYSGHGPDLYVGAGGRLSLMVPCNAFSSGKGYVNYAPAGVNHPVAWTRRATVQTFIGESDLEIKPATTTETEIGQIYLKKDAKAIFNLRPTNQTGWEFNTQLNLWIIAPDVVLPIAAVICKFHEKAGTGSLFAAAEGWYTLAIGAYKPPSGGIPFRCSVTYLGEKE